MLKFLKILPFLIVCLSSLKAQKDTFYLTNGVIHIGKIHSDEGRKIDIDGQYGPILIKKQKLYKIVSANGNVTKFQDLTYLEKGLTHKDYIKILKPLSARPGLLGQRLYYGDIHISRRNFFDALHMIQDSLIDESILKYKRKINASHVLVSTGWILQNVACLSVFLLAPDIHFRNGGLYYYNDQSAFVIYAGAAAILAGLTEVTIGYVQAIVAGKIKKRKLIGRYNSLLLQP